MLVRLVIRDIVLIDRLDLAFEPGLTVLTGETGAGKSILLDAFALTLGARGDGALVRHGEAQGQVTAVFDLTPGHVALAAAREHDIETDGELILRRIQMADGRTRAFVNDQPVGAQVLRAIGRQLVEIHGQHDDRALVNAASHRQILDAYGGLGVLATTTREACARLKAARAEHAGEAARLAAAAAEADYIRHALAELHTLDPCPGEEADLAERRAAMMNAEKLTVEIRDALEAVVGDAGPMSALSAALRRLERRRPQAPALLDPPAQALDAALTALDAAGQALEQALRAASFEAGALEAAEERLFALRAAARKHCVPVDELGALADRMAATLAALDAGEANLATLAAAVADAAAGYTAAAQKLSAARHVAARGLDKAVNAELGPLKLERALFTTRVETDTAAVGPDGFDQVAFEVQTNPGTRPGPLLKVASGGELARFMLALKVALADRGSAPTLVFDEIDTGVGGAVADAIGQRLGRLAARVQVLAVTHAPQVAARADGHLRIAKDTIEKGKRVATRVAVLAADARREEIARMLAGATITEEARAAAGRLINRAG